MASEWPQRVLEVCCHIREIIVSLTYCLLLLEGDFECTCTISLFRSIIGVVNSCGLVPLTVVELLSLDLRCERQKMERANPSNTFHMIVSYRVINVRRARDN